MEKIKNILHIGDHGDDKTSHGHGTSKNTTDQSHQNIGHSSAGAGQTAAAGLGHGSTDPTFEKNVPGNNSSGLGQGQHERYDPSNMDITSRDGASGLRGGHSKSENTKLSDHSGKHSGIGSSHQHGEHFTDHSRGNTTLPGYGVVQGQTDTAPHLEADPNSKVARTRASADESGNYGGAGAHLISAGHPEHEKTSGHLGGNRVVGHSTNPNEPLSSHTQNTHDPRDPAKIAHSGGGLSSTTGGSHQTGGLATSISGPHQTTAANLLDPHVNKTGDRSHENAIHHTAGHGGGAEEADNDHASAAKKEAVAGSVGLGAIGMASDDHQSRFTNRGADGSAGGVTSMMPGAYPDSTTHLTGNDFQPGEQTVLTDRTRTVNDPISSTGDKEHHYGRDAALVGGVAGLGGAAYGASKSSDKTAYGSNLQGRSHDIMTGDGTSHQTSHAAPLSSNIISSEPRLDNDQTREHHYGRDAALGAGAVGAAGAAYGASKHHDSQSHTILSGDNSSHQTTQAIPHTSNAAIEPRMGRDQTKEHHYGRDAALGTGTIGAAGAGYGLAKHHETQSQPQGYSTTTTTTTNTSTTTSGPHTTHHGDIRKEHDRPKEQKDDAHHDRGAALVGGAGAAAIGAHKLDDHKDKDVKHLHSESHHAEKKHETHDKGHHEPETIFGSSVVGGSKIGDMLHGKARNRGIMGSDGYPDGGAPHDAINHVTGEPLSSSHPLASTEAQRKPSLADSLHGTERNRGVPTAVHGFPHGDGPKTDVNQHTGEPLIGARVPTQQTTPHTTAHHDIEPTHSHSRHGALEHEKQSVDQYNSAHGGQHDILSPTRDTYTHSSSSSAHPGSNVHPSDVDAAPRHLNEQKSDASGAAALDANSGVKTTQGVNTGESQGVLGTVEKEGRNRLHKDPPPGRY